MPGATGPAASACSGSTGSRRCGPRARRSTPREVVATDDADGNLSGLVYHPRPDDRRVTLRLAASQAWVADELPLDARVDGPDGSVRVTLAVSEDAFLERLLLRLGPDAEVVEPAEAAALRTAAAQRLLARYGA